MAETEDYISETEDYYVSGSAVTPCEPTILGLLAGPSLSFSFETPEPAPIMLFEELMAGGTEKSLSGLTNVFTYTIP